jgi:hypothetical protein
VLDDCVRNIVSENSLVQNANRGDIGKCLADVDVALGQ